MTWNYRPGSRYRVTYDCETCNKPYDVVVDETGFFDITHWADETDSQIDMFLAGDSVLQGVGVPSVVEFLREQMPVMMWNLSIFADGPRQKVSALMSHALPKQPKWLILEFYANNDVDDALRTEACQQTRDFRCRFRPAGYRVGRRGTKRDLFETLAYYSSQNLTLATTRHLPKMLLPTLRNMMRGRPLQGSADQRDNTDSLDRPHVVPVMAAPRSSGQRATRLGDRGDGASASRLRTACRKADSDWQSSPTVILLVIILHHMRCIGIC